MLENKLSKKLIIVRFVNVGNVVATNFTNFTNFISRKSLVPDGTIRLCWYIYLPTFNLYEVYYYCNYTPLGVKYW